MKLSSILPLAGLIRTASSSERILNAFGEPSYGADVSFPVHYRTFAKDQPLGDRQKLYEEFMEGCRAYYDSNPNACDVTEDDRVAMSVRQPASMENYTDTGFKKVQAPKQVFDRLSDYWAKHSENSAQKENWPKGNTYVNHWAAPTYMVNVEEQKLRGGGYNLKRKIWDDVKPILEEWTGMELEPSSMYGIRKYTAGAVLSPHADRNPLITSCIINVAQDVDEDWPLEVYGRDGLAYNVTMKPGDMVLYESHSLIHGRPFPLKGKYFANIFIHFKPTGKLLRDRDTSVLTDEGEEKMPIYILRGSPEEKKWLREHPPQRSVRSRVKEAPAAAAGPLEALAHAAATGDIQLIDHYKKNHKDLLHQKDSNGWQPIHEAARGGHLHAVQLFVEEGADINERTNFGEGLSLIELVLDSHSHDHPLVGYLEGLGVEL